MNSTVHNRFQGVHSVHFERANALFGIGLESDHFGIRKWELDWICFEHTPIDFDMCCMLGASAPPFSSAYTLQHYVEDIF